MRLRVIPQPEGNPAVPSPGGPERAGGDAPGVGDPSLEALLRHSPDGLLISGDQGQILFASQVAADALGFDSPGALMAATLEDLAERFVIEEPSGPAAPDAPLPGHEVFHGLPEPDRLLRFRDPDKGWDRWALLRTARSAKHIGRKRAVLTMVRDISIERRRETSALFMEEAASRLGRSLCIDRVLEHAAVVAVTRLADECVVVERQGGDKLAPVAWHIPTYRGDERAVSMVRIFGAQIAEVEASGRALLFPPVADDEYGPGTGSMMLAPVVEGTPKKKEITAVMLLGMAQDTGRSHHPSDLALAEQLGRRVGNALTNARLLETEQRRRHLIAESEACSRHLAQALEARLASLQRELQVRLGPLVSAVNLLERPAAATQRQLIEIVKRQSDQLRELAGALRRRPPPLDTAEITLVERAPYRG